MPCFLFFSLIICCLFFLDSAGGGELSSSESSFIDLFDPFRVLIFNFKYKYLSLMNKDKANINQSVFKLSMEILKELERDGFPSSSGSYCGITFFLFRIEHNFLL